MKRGQVTVFLIVGLAVVLVIFLVWFIKSESSKSFLKEVSQKLTQKPEEINALNNQIKNCIDSLADDALYNLGQQGGYSNIDKISHDKNFAPYYFFEGKGKVPSKVNLERELASLLKLNIESCRIVDEKYEIEYGTLDIETSLGKQVVFDIDWDIKVGIDEMYFKLDKIKIVKNINLLNILNAAKEIVNILIVNSEGVCVSCISDIATKYNLNVETFFNEKDLLVKIIDKNSILKNEPYIFIFSNRFKESLT